MSNELTFTFWDVQHGNATHIRTPNGRDVVIDMGDGDSISGSSGRFSPLMFLRHNEGVKVLDFLLITHPHRDHIDDIENLNSFHVKVLHRPQWLTESEVRRGNRQEDSAKISQYIDLNSRFTTPIARPNDITIPTDWGGAVFKFYASSQVSRDNLNNHSIVTFVEFAASKAMLPGDNEAPSWRSLLDDPAFVKELPAVDVLLAPHHGREAGFCAELFENGLNPLITIISDDQHGSTSVTDKYHARTIGWKVQLPDGTMKPRVCVTTRCDGTIKVTFAQGTPQNFLNVKIGL